MNISKMDSSVLTGDVRNDKLSNSLNLVPIRSEKMDDIMPDDSIPDEQAPGAVSDDIAKMEHDLEEKMEHLRAEVFTHVHHENVRCYRNTQAVIIENTDKIVKQAEKNQRSLKGLMTAVLVFLILNLAATAALAVFMLR
ncbi:hypothetical protein SAMN06296386_11546 [Lachnospiraceae bacterium]|nr:hypothetical protein SAMN06296386_11546 [Lachnospiraceae bacterium]